MPTLEFKGKPFVYSHHLSVPFRELVIDPKKSFPGGKKTSLGENLVIHGDNLEALKALLPRYAGKVDVIYIDPPYNTGEKRLDIQRQCQVAADEGMAGQGGRCRRPGAPR
jgi:adenine-specific DNA-methyltransferase